MQLAFGAGVLYGTQQTDAAGAAIVNPTPVRFGVLQDVSIEISFELKKLYGQKQFPVAAGRGKGSISCKAKAAQLNGAIFAGLFFGLPMTAGESRVADLEPKVGSGATGTTVNSATWAADLGVVYTATGLPLKRVATAPTVGQYSVAAGVYTFAAGDTAANAAGGVLISYRYTVAAVGGNVAISNQLMGYAPTFSVDLLVPFKGKQLTLSLFECISSKFSFPTKQDDFIVPEFEFEAMANAADQVGILSLAEASL